ncbi:hypothetical protein Tco_0426232 [Tanacetum coccineum]
MFVGIVRDGFLQAHYWTSRHHYVISHARLTSDSQPTVQASFADETAGPWVAFAADGTDVAATDVIVEVASASAVVAVAVAVEEPKSAQDLARFSQPNVVDSQNFATKFDRTEAFLLNQSYWPLVPCVKNGKPRKGLDTNCFQCEGWYSSERESGYNYRKELCATTKRINKLMLYTQ